MVRQHAKANVNSWQDRDRAKPYPGNIVQVAKHFRAQPIVVPGSMDLVGLELLTRHRLDYGDLTAMLELDIRALEAASLLARDYRCTQRVHINVEVSSMLDTRWHDAMAGVMCPGIVIEVVERNDLLTSAGQLHRASLVMNAIRNYGGLIALDDVSCSEVEMRVMAMVQPEFIKVECLNLIATVRNHSAARVVVERIETHEQALNALRHGADELQGFWCDLATETQVPVAFTPPGVTARMVTERMVPA